MHLIQRAQVYGYANARTKAMKSLLLPSTKVREMVSVNTASEVAELLQDTQYREDITALSASYSGAELVERALSRNMFRTGKKLLKISPPGGKEVLWRLLRRWEISDLKTLIVGKHTNQSQETLEKNLIGMWVTVKPDKLLKAANVPALVKELESTEYGGELKPFLKEYAAVQEVFPFLNALDKYYYKNLAQSTKVTDDPAVAALINSEVDAKNISTLLRTKGAGAFAERIKELMIHGGSIRREALGRAAAAAAVKDAISILQKEAKVDFAEAITKFDATGSISYFEIAMEKAIMRRVVKTMRIQVLSLAAIFGFLYLKEMEVGNIRKIVRGMDYELPKERVAEMIYVVG